MRFLTNVLNPADVELEITVSMKVSQWNEIVDALKAERYADRWSAARFCESLKEGLRQVEHRALGVVHPEDKPQS